MGEKKKIASEASREVVWGGQIVAKPGDLPLRSALFNTCRKALGHLMKFTQRSIPYRFRLAG